MRELLKRMLNSERLTHYVIAIAVAMVLASIGGLFVYDTFFSAATGRPLRYPQDFFCPVCKVGIADWVSGESYECRSCRRITRLSEIKQAER